MLQSIQSMRAITRAVMSDSVQMYANYLLLRDVYYRCHPMCWITAEECKGSGDVLFSKN